MMGASSVSICVVVLAVGLGENMTDRKAPLLLGVARTSGTIQVRAKLVVICSLDPTERFTEREKGLHLHGRD